MSDYRLVPADELDQEGLGRLQRVYESGFPPHRHAAWTQVYDARLATETALAVLDQNGVPVGFVFFRAMGRTDRIYLRFLAVDAGRRGRGIGSIAWDLLTAYCRSRGLRAVVWDVEHPDQDGVPESEAAIRRRRIEFYRRLGGVVLPVEDYTNPHADSTGVHEVPMLLMAASLTDATLPTDATWAAGVHRDVNHHRWNR